MNRIVVIASLFGLLSSASAGPSLVRAVQTLSDLADRGTTLNQFEYSETCPAPNEAQTRQRCDSVGGEAIAAEWQHAVSTIGRTEARERLGRNGLSDAFTELQARARAVSSFRRCEHHSRDHGSFHRRVFFVDKDRTFCPSFTLGYYD